MCPLEILIRLCESQSDLNLCWAHMPEDLSGVVLMKMNDKINPNDPFDYFVILYLLLKIKYWNTLSYFSYITKKFVQLPVAVFKILLDEWQAV